MPGHIKKTSGPDPDPSPWVKPSSIIADSIIFGILKCTHNFPAGGEGPHQGGPEEEGKKKHKKALTWIEHTFSFSLHPGRNCYNYSSESGLRSQEASVGAQW